MSKKKAYLVDVTFQVRVVVKEHIDPNMDEEFDEAVYKVIKERLEEEKLKYVSENIIDFDEDETNPYNPKYDE
jgi:heat shock protein HspQ